jgi:hypothetical protein
VKKNTFYRGNQELIDDSFSLWGFVFFRFAAEKEFFRTSEANEKRLLLKEIPQHSATAAESARQTHQEPKRQAHQLL